MFEELALFFHALFLGSFGNLHVPERSFEPIPILREQPQFRKIKPPVPVVTKPQEPTDILVDVQTHTLMVKIRPGEMTPAQLMKNDERMKKLGLPTGYRIFE